MQEKSILIVEDEGDEPRQKYEGKVLITKKSEEETQKTKRRFFIKKINTGQL